MGEDYVFEIDGRSQRSGKIFRREALCWQYGPTGGTSRDVVFSDENQNPLLRIRRVGHFPATCELVQGGNRVGEVVLRSLLRNRYQVTIEGHGTWDFKMPLFTSRFFGVSASGSRIFAAVGGNQKQWYVRTEPGTNLPSLLFALAFIHNRAWNSG